MSFTFSTRGLLATIATAATLVAAPVSAQIITQPYVDSPVLQWGNSGGGFIPTIGQSFVAAGPFLNSFTFWLSNEASIGSGDANTPNADQLSFRAYLAAWDGSGIVGDVLYDSGDQTGPTSLSQGYTFNTGALAVTSGASYIAFLTVPDLGDLVSSAALEGSSMNSGGGLAFLGFSNDVFALVSGGSNEWLSLVNDAGEEVPLRFQATFSQTATVPEPSTGVLLGAGLAGLIFVARRRRA